jgi:hypothetical protein
MHRMQLKGRESQPSGKEMRYKANLVEKDIKLNS